MKKLLGIIFMLLVGFTLVACEVEEAKPTPEDEIEDVIPEEDEDLIPEEDEDENTEPEVDEEDENIVYEDKVIVDESNLVKGEFKNITLDVKGYNKIKITIVGESTYDIPVNINNFIVDGEAVEYSGMVGTSYVVGFDFKIGNLDAVANLMNTHKFEDVVDIRLHTVHHTLTDPHSLIINVEGVSEISFGYRVTTNAYEYVDSLNIEMTAIEQE